MKTLPTLLLAVLLCGSALAATFQETKQAVVASLSTGKIEVRAVDRSKGTAPRFNLTPIEYIAALGDAGSKLHLQVWTSLQTCDVAALPTTAETKTLLSRDLDPALAALEAVQKNPAGRTHAHVEALEK